MNIPFLAYQVAAAHDRLWAINPERAEAIAALFVSNPQAFSIGMGASDRADERPPEGIALVSLHGVMSRAGMPCMESASTIDIQRAIRAAMKDDAVKAIVLDIDSPGGAVAGTADLADLVATVNKTKPVYAYTPDTACSAAYWVASQAKEIWASPNAMSIGNIGVRASSADTTKAYEAEGVQMRHYATGAYKSLGAEGVPIPEEHHDEMQRLVDEQGSKFFAAVQKGRHLSDEQLSAVTDGRWFTADVAKENGLIDKVGSLQDLYQMISSRQAASPVWQLSPAARPAASAPPQMTTMSKLLDKIAFWRSNPEAAKAAGIADASELDAMEAEAKVPVSATHQPLDPSVLKMIEDAKASAESANNAAQAQSLAVASALANSEAKAFADSLIHPDASGRSTVHPVSRASLENGFRAAAMADGGGLLKIDAQGKLVTGANVEAFQAAFKDIPRNVQGGDTIPDGDPNANGSDTGMTSEQRRAWAVKNGGGHMLSKENN